MKKQISEPNTKRRIFAVIFFTLLFGSVIGVFFAYMCGRFVPVLFTNWAGSFVCEGEMVFQSLRRTFQCYTSPTVSYELGDKVFWTMFKIFLFPCIGISSILLLAFFAVTDFLLTEKE